LITVRNATERDYPAIARIQSFCPQAAQWPVGDYSNYRTLIAYAGAEAVGFCAWRQVSDDEAELLNLAVLPAARRTGVASSLLGALGNTAKGDLFLEVAETNSAAVSLYTKRGWEQIGVRKGYYENGSTNAVVMKKGSC
jgi:[ribosomal protein S18]-alanine N-acetyltransferase